MLFSFEIKTRQKTDSALAVMECRIGNVLMHNYPGNSAKGYWLRKQYERPRKSLESFGAL